MFNHTASTITASLLALIIAALIWVVGRQRWPRVTVFLVIGGAGGLVSTTVGRYIHMAIDAVYGWVGQWTGSLFGVGGGIVAFAAAVVLAVIVGFHVHHREITEKTLAMAALIPWSATFVPGPFGTVLADIVGLCVNVVGSVGYFLFHGHF